MTSEQESPDDGDKQVSLLYKLSWLVSNPVSGRQPVQSWHGLKFPPTSLRAHVSSFSRLDEHFFI